jgi:hypothetical protein
LGWFMKRSTNSLTFLPPDAQNSLWNNEQKPKTTEKDWDSLTEEEQKAANLLGFNRKKWEADRSITPVSSCINIDWKDDPQKVKKAAHTLDYNESILNNDGESPLDAVDWSELTTDQRDPIMLIG